MGMTAAELADRMSLEEFLEHAADYALDPWGEGREDLRMGILAATVANAAPGKKKRVFTPSDFMLQANDEPDEATVRKQFIEQQRRRANAKTRH